jgi:hypothetical protein
MSYMRGSVKHETSTFQGQGKSERPWESSSVSDIFGMNALPFKGSNRRFGDDLEIGTGDDMKMRGVGGARRRIAKHTVVLAQCGTRSSSPIEVDQRGG